MVKFWYYYSNNFKIHIHDTSSFSNRGYIYRWRYNITLFDQAFLLKRFLYNVDTTLHSYRSRVDGDIVKYTTLV